MNDKVLKVVYVSIGAFGAIYIYTYCWSLLSQRLAQRLRERYLQSLMRQDLAFFDKRWAGEVVSRLHADIQTIQSGTSEKVGFYLVSISLCITSYVIVFVKDARLTGMLVYLLPAYLVMSLVGGRLVERYFTRMSENTGAAASIVSECLSHISVVQTFNANMRLEKKLAGFLQLAGLNGIKNAVDAAVQAGSLYFTAYAANALAFWQGGCSIAEEVSKWSSWRPRPG